jgi:hypothetical protein
MQPTLNMRKIDVLRSMTATPLLRKVYGQKLRFRQGMAIKSISSPLEN